jgi:hypothetical protein
MIEDFPFFSDVANEFITVNLKVPYHNTSPLFVNNELAIQKVGASGRFVTGRETLRK